MLARGFEDESQLFPKAGEDKSERCSHLESPTATRVMRRGKGVAAGLDLRSGSEEKDHAVKGFPPESAIPPSITKFAVDWILEQSVGLAYTNACGNRTFAPYTAPLRAPFRIAR